MSDLIERLRRMHFLHPIEGVGLGSPLWIEAADRIAALTAKNEELRKKVAKSQAEAQSHAADARLARRETRAMVDFSAEQGKQLDSAQQALAEAVEALEPFANAAAAYDPPEGDDDEEAFATRFSVGSLRKARAARGIDGTGGANGS